MASTPKLASQSKPSSIPPKPTPPKIVSIRSGASIAEILKKK